MKINKRKYSPATLGAAIAIAAAAALGLYYIAVTYAAQTNVAAEVESAMLAGKIGKIEGDKTASGEAYIEFGGKNGLVPTDPNPGPDPTPVPTDPTVGAKNPADVLDLKMWKLTLPIAADSGSGPKEVLQPELATFSIDPWFKLNADKTGVVFRANHGAGATTSSSSNPRSELREMSADGKTEASWSSTSGTHTMTIKQKVTKLTTVKPHVVVGQIHDSSDDVTVFRLEGTKLMITDGNKTDAYVIDGNYVLGTVFTVKIEVSGGKISYYYNDKLLPYSQTKDFSGAYFKAGNYLQSNPKSAPGESPDAYSEVEIYDLKVTHQ